MRQILFLLLLCLLLPACRTIHEESGTDVNRHEFSKDSPELRQIGEELLKSIQDGNFKQFAKYVNSGNDKITEEDFHLSEKNIREQFGKIISYEYLADLELPLMHNMIWKVTFEREGKNQDRIKQELLFRLVLGTINGKPHIVSMGFL